MKKMFSLVLALVMTVSLFAVAPASADAAFTDSSSITYKEAVDVIYSLGIMGGYSDGSFRPNGLLTRGAASKIICCMMLTPAIANNMSNTSATKFKDVPAGHTFAGFIGWCVQQGIVSGYSDNTFHPADPLSCQAFLKMLLCALGYDQTIEHYTGSGWSNNVTNQALIIGLNNGLTGTLNGTAQVNRQDACLFAFNALKSDLVEYNGSRNNRSLKTTTAARGTNILNEGASPYTLQFAEQYFSDLKQTANTMDAFGCPATKWTLKNVEVGTYLASVKKVYYNQDVTAGTVYSDLGLTVDTPLVFYLNGVNVANANETLKKNDTRKLSQLITQSNVIGNGVEIRAFTTVQDNKNVVVLSAVVYYPGTVASVQSATSSRNRYITISGISDGGRAPAGLSTSNHYETEDFDVGDIVAYTFSAMEGKAGVQNVIALDTVRGKMNRLRTGSSLEIDNAEYINALNIVYGNAQGKESDLKVNDTYTIHLLTLGGEDMVMWVENVTASSDSYAWVKDISNGRQNFDYAQASLVFANGTEEVVRLSVYEVPEADSPKGKIVTYTVGTNNRYTLTPVKSTDTVSNFSIKNRDITPKEISANNSTIFVVQDTAAKAYKVYTGTRSMPNVAGTSAYVYSEDGVAVIVFVSDATITTTKGDLVFIAANSASSPVRDSSTYRTFNAVVGGQIVKLNVLVDTTLGNEGDTPKSGARLTVANDANKPAPENSVVLDSVDYNADELVIGGVYNNANVSVGRAQGLSAPSNGSIRLGANGTNRGTSMDLSSSVNVYSVSTNGTISKIALNTVRADSDDWVYYTQDNKDITNLFIIRVDANS